MPNARGHRVIRLYAEQAAPRESTPPPRQGAPEHEAADGRTDVFVRPDGHLGGANRVPRLVTVEGKRVSADVAHGCGVECDKDLDDDIPF